MTAPFRCWLILVMLLTGCNLFKKTSKTTATETQRMEKKSELNMLELKTANRHTSIFTVWDSGMVYQHQLILEQIDKAKLRGMKATEVGTTKTKVVEKKTKPADLWIYTGIGLFLIGAGWVFWKLRSRYAV
jgi:hypothetical protein